MDDEFIEQTTMSEPMTDADWKRLALCALYDLRVLGVPIEKMLGIDDDVLAEVERYSRESTSYT